MYPTSDEFEWAEEYQAYGYPVRWDRTPNRLGPSTGPWHSELWPEKSTWPKVIALIELLAAEWDRSEHINALYETVDNPHVVWGADASGRFKFYSLETRDRRAVTLCHAIHRAIRTYLRAVGALIVRQVDMTGAKKKRRRTIRVRYELEARLTIRQLERLKRALDTATDTSVTFQIEVAYFGLTGIAWDYLQVGWRVAGRRGDLARFCGEPEAFAAIVRRPVLSPELLRLVVPYAIRAAHRPGRRPEHARDEALRSVLEIFREVSGFSGNAASRVGNGEPVGPGADFVRGIEEIFHVQLMPPGSTHAIRRASKIDAAA